MTKFNKQYVYYIKNEEDKIKIRKWVGSHNGMSISMSDWVYVPSGISMDMCEVYILNIKNKKTELLFKLTFPNIIEVDKFDDRQEKLFWDWNVIR